MHNSEIEYFSGDAMAADVWRGKYALTSEKTPDAMHWRMAKEFARIEYNRIIKYRKHLNIEDLNKLSAFGNSTLLLNDEELPDEELLTYLENKIYNLFKEFTHIVPQGSIMAMLGSSKIGSLSNCFVVGQPHDSYGGIFQKDQQLAQLMKRRGGVGIDISTLRPSQTSVSNSAGTSTGAVSFMERYSNTTREVAQNGRRGALMISIDIRHPDVLEFINVKKDKTKVTGANISIMLRDDFMEAVEKDEDYILRFPCKDDRLSDLAEGECIHTGVKDYNKLITIYSQKGGNKKPEIAGYTKRVKAKEYYDSIVENAWLNAEPGQIFINKHWDNSPDTVYPEYKGVTTNPCGEIFMGMYDACRLLAINLYSIVKNPFTDDAEIDYTLLYELSYEQQRLADNLIDLELEHISRIINKIKADPEPEEIKRDELELWQNVHKITKGSRRTGCGFTGLGDMLAALNLKYGSDEAMVKIAKVMHTKTGAELDCTIDLAILKEPFKGWNKNLEYSYDKKTSELIGTNKFYTDLFAAYPDKVRRMYKYGRRNVSWSTVAPTGSVSILTQTTSGLEPLFAAYYMRRKKINPGEEGVRIDFIDQNGDSWMEYPILHPKLKYWIELQNNKSSEDEFLQRYDVLNKQDVDDAFKKSPWYGSTANDISWISRILTQEIIQKYTTHSISSTINLPNHVTKQEVSDIYMSAFKHNLKGVTVYRDGSRTGVLITDGSEDLSEFKYNNAVKRPKSLICKVHQSTYKGEDWLIAVGILHDKPYEVFCVKNTWVLPKGILDADITKVNRGNYKLEIKDVLTIESLALDMTAEQEAITRLISISLRHRADIKYVVEQLNKTDGDMQAFNKVLARNIKKYIPDGDKTTGVTCDNCGADAIIYEEGCQKCKSCGTSKC